MRRLKMSNIPEEQKSELYDYLALKTYGVSDDIPEKIMRQIDKTVEELYSSLRGTEINSKYDEKHRRDVAELTPDPDVYTNIKSMMMAQKDNMDEEFSSIFETMYAQNRRFYSVLKDYEIMPLLVPQITRVLQFIVNETISPDIQNNKNFELKVRDSGTSTSSLQQEVNEIRRNMNLDRVFREVIENRYKYHREYYRVIDYNESFERVGSILRSKMLNESITTGRPMNESLCTDVIDKIISETRVVINEASVTVPVTTFTSTDINQKDNRDISLDDLNIVVDRSSVLSLIESARDALIIDKYSNSSSNILSESFSSDIIGKSQKRDRSFLDKLSSLVGNLAQKKYNKCQLERLDPSRVFPLVIGKDSTQNIIGYFYVEKIDGAKTGTTAWINNLGVQLRNKLVNSRDITNVVNPNMSSKSIQELMAKKIAEKIIRSFDPDIGIDNIKDIELLHDYIINNEIYNGNKKLTFYYKDELFDLTRTDGSLLINAVFQTKLYVMMILNNILTKVLRGRGRQIHTVKTGASRNIRKYINNAMLSLNNPHANLGIIHGSLENLINAVNSASDIIFPTEDGSERFITTDYIEGQNVDMDTDFLKFLLNSIVLSFGYDSAIIDATNGQIQFAKTFSMESIHVCNNIKAEQNDLYPEWNRLCMRILSIAGSNELRTAVTGGKVELSFFQPKSLMLQNSMDEINNAKNYAETIADCIPQFNTDSPDNFKRSRFVWSIVRSKVNIDWEAIDSILAELDIMVLDDKLKDDIEKHINTYTEQMKTVDTSIASNSDGTSESDYSETDGDMDFDDDMI